MRAFKEHPDTSRRVRVTSREAERSILCFHASKYSLSIAIQKTTFGGGLNKFVRINLKGHSKVHEGDVMP
jgi:hypothetical protein